MIRRPPRSTPLSLHDALPIWRRSGPSGECQRVWEILAMTRPSPPESELRYRPYSPASTDRKSTRLNSSHSQISYAVFCLKKKNIKHTLVHRSTLIYASYDIPD